MSKKGAQASQAPLPQFQQSGDKNAISFMKANKRYSALIAKYAIEGTATNPIQLDPDSIGTSMYNREGSQLNMAYVHGGTTTIENIIAASRMIGFDD